MLDAPLDIPLIPIFATLSCGVAFAQTNKCFENGGGRELNPARHKKNMVT